MKKNKISVVVCTYNRNKLLKKCLDSLNNQSEDQNNYEVIVVDNFKNKDTKKLVNKYRNYRYIVEKKTGLSYARNNGWKNAKQNLVAFIDDDAVAKKDWIENIIDFSKKHPKVKIFGGPYEKHSYSKIPEWIPENYGQQKISHKQKKLAYKKEWLSGTNIIIEKNLLKKLNGFDPKLGMKGKQIGYAEETDFQLKALESGEDIYYSPKIIVSHLFDQRKYKLFWLLKNTYCSGKYSSSTESIKRTSIEKLADIFKGIVQFFKWVFMPKKLHIKYRVFKSLEKIVYEIGSLQSKIGNK